MINKKAKKSGSSTKVTAEKSSDIKLSNSEKLLEKEENI